jgi:phage I-like protein
MPAKLPKRLERAALAFVDLFDGGAVATAPKSEFQIFGPGVNSSVKGDFLFDDQAAAMVMAAYHEHGVDLTIDYDHHTLYVDRGVKAVSAGWFGLDLRDGALWATNVRWNPPALAHFSNGEYRYFSPLFDYDKKTGRIEKLINNALLNTPALFGIDALMAAGSLSQTTDDTEDQMDLKEALDRITELERQNAASTERIKTLEGQTATAALSATVGLAPTAGTDEIRGKVVALTGFRKEVMTLVGKDTDAAALGALTGLMEKAAAEPELRSKLEKAETAALSATWAQHLDGLSTKGEDGKHLPPAKREKAEKMALSFGGGKLTAAGIEAAKEYVAEMLVVASDGTGAGDKQAKGTVALSATEQEIAQRTGSDPKKVIEYKQRRLEGGRS